MARKRIALDLAEVERLAGLGLTQGQIAASLGISEDTLGRRKKDSADFAAAIEKGAAFAASEIANVIYDAAKKGDMTAAIFYAKARMGWRDRDATLVVDGTLTNDPNVAALGESLSGIKKRLDGTASGPTAGAPGAPAEPQDGASVRTPVGQDHPA